VAGRDGNLWFTEQASNQVAFFKPNGGNPITALSLTQLPVDTQPAGITVGPDNNIWLTESNTSPGDHAIVRITTDSNHTITAFSQGLPFGSEPLGITMGPDASGKQVLWFTDVKSGELGKLDLNNNDSITEIPLPNSLMGFQAFNAEIAAGPGGTIWFTEATAGLTATAIGVYSPATGAFAQVVLPSTNGVQVPFQLTQGPDGNVWFTAAVQGAGGFGSGVIGVINPNPTNPTLIRELPAGSSSQPTGITTGPDGDIWYTDSKGGAIGTVRVNKTDPTQDTLGTPVAIPTATVPHPSPVAIAPGPDGNLWIADAADAIGVVTLDTQLVVTTPANVTVGSPFDLTVTEQYVGTGATVTAASGSVSISIASGPTGSTLGGSGHVALVNGVARFSAAAGTGLTLTPVGTYSLKVSMSGGRTATTNPFAVATSNPTPTPTPAPTIISEQVILTRKTNKRGKPVGKAVLSGFLLRFSTAMNAGTAGNPNDYFVGKAVIKKVKKKQGTLYQPVSFHAVYSAASDAVQLLLNGKQTFPKGGQVTVMASPPGGVESAAGVFLAAPTLFVILPNARGIMP
jgi:streptogramin lyase